jgi:lipopolysaccharide export system permease protein
MWRLHRYLASEIVRPFLAALLLLFQLLFAMQLLRGTDLVFGAGAGVADVGQIALLLAPHFLAMAMPIAFLVGALIGFGRLAEDRELLALSAAGVDPGWLLPVPLALAALLAAAGLALGQGVEPRGLAGVRDHAGQMLRKNLQGEVKPGVFFDDLTGLTLYAEQVDPRTHAWRHVLVHDDRDRNAPLLVLAQRGRLEDAPGAAVALDLADGQVHRSAGTGDEYAVLGFEQGRIEVGLGEAFFRKSAFRANTEELTVAELRQAAATANAEGRPEAPALWTALARRHALPLAPLAFALVVVPLGSRLRRSARSLGFVLAAGSFALYYVLARAGQQWGDAGKLSPWLAAQLANLVFVALGLSLLQAARRRA